MIASKTPRSDEAWHEARHGEDGDALYKEAQKMEQELAIWIDNAKNFDSARMKVVKERDDLRLELEKAMLRLAEIAKWNATPPIKHRGKWSLLLQDGIEEFNNLTKTEAQALRQAARRMCIKVAIRKTQDQGWTAIVTSRPLRMETQPLPLSENLTP